MRFVSRISAVAEEYPDVELCHMYVDNASMQMIRDPSDDHVADLARRARVACQELAAEHHAAADARAERDDDGALRAAAAAEQRLAQRRGVCVVAEVDGKRSMRAQRASQVEVHKIQVRRKAHDAARVVHRAGAADAHAADGVLADRELRDDLTDASRDRLGAEIDARRDRMLL